LSKLGKGVLCFRWASLYPRIFRRAGPAAVGGGAAFGASDSLCSLYLNVVM